MKKVLIVDDEPQFVELIKIRLEANGYETKTASTGEEGLVYVENHPPDAVLLDILMPGIDGLEVLRRIRKKNKSIPVFMLTAFSDEKRFLQAKELGASGFIVKTGDLKKEIENITNMLKISDNYRSAEPEGDT
ncbi:MAG: response regulator [Candidatus Omnitrophica bacterium]|nr:response regulator [Candidatus Omnitrophota bacterium]